MVGGDGAPLLLQAGFSRSCRRLFAPDRKVRVTAAAPRLKVEFWMGQPGKGWMHSKARATMPALKPSIELHTNHVLYHFAGPLPDTQGFKAEPCEEKLVNRIVFV